MNKTLKALALAAVATFGLNVAAAGQTVTGKTVVTATTIKTVKTTTTSNADSTVTKTTTTTEAELEPDFISDVLKAAAKSMNQSVKDTFTSLKATADSSWAQNADALREIIKVDAKTANQILDMLNVVADSVANRSKKSLGTTKKITVDVANKISEAVKRGAKEAEEEANKRNEALTDSVKQSIASAQAAIDELVKKLDDEADAQQK